MKIYLFNPETGVYQGEDFSDDPSMCAERGALPPGATPLAPPPYGCGEVPVFSVTDNRWEIRPICAAAAAGSEEPCRQSGGQSKRQTLGPTG